MIKSTLTKVVYLICTISSFLTTLKYIYCEKKTHFPDTEYMRIGLTEIFNNYI